MVSDIAMAALESISCNRCWIIDDVWRSISVDKSIFMDAMIPPAVWICSLMISMRNVFIYVYITYDYCYIYIFIYCHTDLKLIARSKNRDYKLQCRNFRQIE